MKVFKLYTKIVKRSIGSVIVYFIVFLVVIFLFVGSEPTPTTGGFTESRLNVALFNHDEDTELITDLKQYLEKYVVYQDIEEELIDDALYFRIIRMVIIIPENFTTDFLAGNDTEILEQSIPDVTTSIKQAITKYLNLVKLYQTHTNNNLTQTLVSVHEALEQEANATRQAPTTNTFAVVEVFFNFLSYAAFALIVSIITMMMIRIRTNEVKQRMVSSPYTQTKTNLELLFGHFLFALITVAILSLLSFYFYPSIYTKPTGALYIANTITIAFAFCGIGYFISFLIKSENAIAPIVNVISLGACFMSGAFVPQVLLDEKVLMVARILPHYYFVKNNESIRYVTVFDGANLQPIIINMVIQVAFAVVFIALAILINKQQNRSEQ